MLTSVGSKTSSMPVIELTVVPPSLIESAAIWEWQSMMPGATNLPVASTTSAPAGIGTFAPTAAILPPRSTMIPFGIVPLVAVRIVAPLIATTESARGCACGREAADAPATHSSRMTMDVKRRGVMGARIPAPRAKIHWHRDTMGSFMRASVGPYQILERIGAGGMGEVFLGHDPRLERRVALKCLTSAETSSEQGRARVLREARAAARLNHPNIAGVHDVLELDDGTFIVMEYVEGISLAAHLASGPLPVEQAAGRRLGAVADAAAAAANAKCPLIA